MAVSAYASVLSLMRVLDIVRHPSRIRFLTTMTEIQVLHEKLTLLQDFLEVHSSTISEDTQCLARIISEITSNAEAVMDKYIARRLSRRYEDGGGVIDGIIESFRNDINRVIEEIDAVHQAMAIMPIYEDIMQRQPRLLFPVPSPTIIPRVINNVVMGFEEQLDQIMNNLVVNRPNLEIVPIVGMGGIGKTTLAKSVFDHPYNLHHFHVRIWLTISQHYNVEKLLKGLSKGGILGDQKAKDEGDHYVSVSELELQLYRKLFGQRYLIVMDDVWDTEAWDDLKRVFPDNENGSRIIVTTRLSNVANSLGSRDGALFSVKFLNEDKSWDLLREKAFARGGSSAELEEIGREISKSCRGLPLLLVVIGGLLANSNMTREYWQSIAKDVISFATSNDEDHCVRILSLSYHHLPIHLKTCFLFMRHYPEDSNVQVSDLIKAWVVQGVVKPMKEKTLEEAAREYLQDLIERNMLLIHQRGSTRDVKFCGIHDLLRDLCIKESDKEHFLQVPNVQSITSDFKDVCFLCEEGYRCSLLYCDEIFGSESDYKDRPRVCSSCESAIPQLSELTFALVVKYDSKGVPVLTKCRWLSIDDYESSMTILGTVYLLWNLQILYIRGRSRVAQPVLPKEIWEMPPLSHVRVYGYMLPDPIDTSDDLIVLENLEMLTTIEQFKCTEEIVRRIPNLKKLGLYYNQVSTGDNEEDWSYYCLQNLACLQKLRSLSITCGSIPLDITSIAFPCSLKKLILENCGISWNDLTIIGSLPNLELLKLLFKSVVGQEWSPIEGEFSVLRYLKLEGLDLVRWRAEDCHYPALEILVLENMEDLEAIPELPTLNSIYLDSVTENVIDSAKFLVEEQHSYGNESLIVHVKDVDGRSYQIGGPSKY